MTSNNYQCFKPDKTGTTDVLCPVDYSLTSLAVKYVGLGKTDQVLNIQGTCTHNTNKSLTACVPLKNQKDPTSCTTIGTDSSATPVVVNYCDVQSGKCGLFATKSKQGGYVGGIYPSTAVIADTITPLKCPANSVPIGLSGATKPPQGLSNLCLICGPSTATTSTVTVVPPAAASPTAPTLTQAAVTQAVNAAKKSPAKKKK